MTEASRHDAWQAGDSYDLYMGRWSRQIAPKFLEWLDIPDDQDWLDVGCGTGALSERAFWTRRAPTCPTVVQPFRRATHRLYRWMRQAGMWSSRAWS